jgi:hypothetical protein
MSIVLAVVLGAVAARASPFWVTWEEGWPEEQGWMRGSTGPPAERWLDGGLLFIDTRAEFGIRDQYYQNPASLMPGPQEMFTVEWGVRVYESTPSYDPGVLVVADDHYSVNFCMDTQSVHSEFEPGRWASFAPNEFHEFVLNSTDMRTYDLYIDGALALQGSFFESFLAGPDVDWGNFAGCKTLTAWDHVAYGIIPEPSALLCVLIPLCYRPSLKRSASPRSRYF